MGKLHLNGAFHLLDLTKVRGLQVQLNGNFFWQPRVLTFL